MEREFDRIEEGLRNLQHEDMLEKISFGDGIITMYKEVEMDERLDELFAIFDSVPSQVITNIKLPEKVKLENSKPPLTWGKMYSTKPNHVDVRYEDILWVTHDDCVELRKIGSDYAN